MNKIALSLAILAGLSSAAFASQRNLDPDFIYGSPAIVSEQGAAVVGGSTGNAAYDAMLRNMEEQSQSDRK